MSKEGKAINVSDALIKAKSSKIFIAKDEVFDRNNNTIFVNIPHPGHNISVPFCINVNLKKVHEIQRFKESYRSFFIDNVFKSDGTLYIATPFDPIFFVLPILQSKCIDKAIPLEHIISLIESDHNEVLKDIIIDLSHVADLKGPKDLCAYKYNEEKTMEWLQSKVKLVEAALKNTNINVVSSATSATYVQSESMKSENEDSYLKYAFGIVSEYLNPELAKNLSEKFGFKPDEIPTLSNKRKSLTEFNAESNIKKPKIEKNNVTTKETENEIPVKKIENKKTELTTKEKQRLKAASGTRNISSFFTKK